MAPVGRTGLLQLLRGTGKPCPLGCPSGSSDGALMAHSASPESETLDFLDARPCLSGALASPTPCAPSFSRCSLRRYPSAMRTGCANQRPSGSVEGVVSNHDPYSDRQLRICFASIRLSQPLFTSLAKLF